MVEINGENLNSANGDILQNQNMENRIQIHTPSLGIPIHHALGDEDSTQLQEFHPTPRVGGLLTNQSINQSSNQSTTQGGC